MSAKHCMCMMSKGKNKGKFCWEVTSYCRNPTHRQRKHKPIVKKTVEKIEPTKVTSMIEAHSEPSTLDLIRRLERLESKVKELEEAPPIVIVIEKGQSYHSILSKLTNETQASKFLTSCAVTELEGDVKLYDTLHLAPAEKTKKLLDTFKMEKPIVKKPSFIPPHIKTISIPPPIQSYIINTREAYLQAIIHLMSMDMCDEVTIKQTYDKVTMLLQRRYGQRLTNAIIKVIS